ncbi:hypothetical protein PVAND_005176 [Polypedilum vanderplanki]|uniref:Uncharacterized protein n=1 Tax=Polypedilum vanderplanki TaxID=319348 RepID=A0A9J6C099_POLVA|nr:hypothetical protein PVAND_005176 [Polypedilum vanderplanki]
MGNNVSTTARSELPSLYDQPQTFPRQEKKFILPKSNTIDRRNKNNNSDNNNNNQESSRMLFLMYLIHRTWNVVVDGKGKRDDQQNKSNMLEIDHYKHRNDDNISCTYGSECSYCSCGYCDDEDCRVNGNYSICER